jgi:co-chaperonin GroES (HSP10)
MLEETENVRPLRDRVLVKELPWPGKTGGNLYLPDQAQKRDELWRAVVLAVGPGKPPLGLLRRALKLLENAPLDEGPRPPAYHEEAEAEERKAWSDARAAVMRDVLDGITVGFGAEVRPGDVVLVSKYVHTKVRIGGEECCIIAATDILGVVADGSEQLREALQLAWDRLPSRTGSAGSLDGFVHPAAE